MKHMSDRYTAINDCEFELNRAQAYFWLKKNLLADWNLQSSVPQAGVLPTQPRKDPCSLR